MDWFEKITGFTETSYGETRNRLSVEGGWLQSRVTGRRFAVGQLEVVSLQLLRERVASGHNPPGRLTVRNISGDVRRMHQTPEFSGALFQVASQFNLLEMVSPKVTPEQGVTRYQHDRTQGPACAIAAGAATIYRNYFAPLRGGEGQTAERQVDCLEAVGSALAEALAQPVEHFWIMKNGYALCSAEGLRKISAHLDCLDTFATDKLRGLLQIGVHEDVEVTDWLVTLPNWSLRHSAPRCQWPTAATRRRCGDRSRSWCLTQLMKQLSWPACSARGGAVPTSCSSPVSAGVPSVTMTPGSTRRCGAH